MPGDDVKTFAQALNVQVEIAESAILKGNRSHLLFHFAVNVNPDHGVVVHSVQFFIQILWVC